MIIMMIIKERYKVMLKKTNSLQNQAVIQDGRVDIQSKNVGYNAAIDENVQRNPRTTANTGKTTTVQCYNCNEKCHYARECPKPMLEELNASVIMMARIQPTDNDLDAEPIYDAEFVNEVNASQINLVNGLPSKSDHEQKNHKKLETIKPTYVDDQTDSDIIFDDPYVEVNGGQVEHDQDAHDQRFSDFKSLIKNVKIEAKNQRMVNMEMKKENALIT
ncbi:retrovirus-related pol polyprotein from transposon TNT 1-94 [Tanacetum coccineum]